SGAALAFGSDAPVETANPITGVYAAVNRQTIEGRPLHGWYRREEGIRCLDALRGYTVGPAAASGEAELKGKLLPGYLADIVVLSDDITRRRGKSLLDAKVEFVIVGGRLKYRRRRA
ncbi:MAG: amidohydrolase family protein, partial [Armatimonadota bacterium]|nr:amidohydrolase family protein [Armatimonadota bacterium]